MVGLGTSPLSGASAHVHTNVHLAKFAAHVRTPVHLGGTWKPLSAN